MEAIIRFSLRNRLLVVLLWVLLAAVGMSELPHLPMDAVPDLTNVQVQIITDSPGYASEEVEQLVTIPVELAMNGAPDVEEVRSITRSGLSVVTVVFRDGTDLYRARQLVGERLAGAREKIPPRFGAPEMAPISTGLGEVYQFEVRGEGKSAMELREILDWEVIPRLRALDGVVEVNSFGGESRTFEITVVPAAMIERRVRLSDIVSAVRASNRSEGGGALDIHEESLVVRGESRLRSEADIADIVIRTETDGGVLTVGQVATVARAPMPRKGGVTRDGKGEAVTGIVMMLVGANSREVARRVHETVRELDESRPDISIDTFYDRTALVDRTIRTVVVNLLLGGGLVILVLLLLMGSLRAGLLVAMAVPLSFLGAVLGMRILGISGNLMSLGALDFGIIVDGSVVMVDNIAFRLAGRELDRRQRLGVVEGAATEMGRPAAFGILIIAVVYLPVLSLRGIEGKMFGPMALVMVFALCTALLCALTLTPVLASVFFRRVPERPPIFFRACSRVYERVLPAVMTRPLAVSLLSLAVIAGAAATFGRLGAVFLPKLDEGDLALSILRQPEVGLSESMRQASRVEALLLERFPEVRTIVSRTGQAEIATDPMGLDHSDVFVLLHPRDRWPRPREKDELARAMKEHLEAHIPGIGFAVSQPIELRVNELLEGVRADVGVAIYGDDLDELDDVARRVAEVLARIPGAGDVEAARTTGLPQLRVRAKQRELARHGLRPRDVLDAVSAVGGLMAGLVFENERRFEIRVRLPASMRDGAAALRRIPLVTAGGDPVPLEEVADVDESFGPAAVSRAFGKRRLMVHVNVRGRDLVGFVKEAKEVVDRDVSLPPGWYIGWGGQFQRFETATRGLLVAIPAALLLIFGLLHSTFRSSGRALLIYLAVPTAACGGVFALWARTIPFSISAAVGFIALSGVAVLNGVVLMTTIQRNELDGAPRFEAARAAASARLRAVLMTALTDVIGFFPMAFSTSDGAEVQRPLATVVIGGLLTATLLTLLVLPAVYGWGGARARALGGGRP